MAASNVAVAMSPDLEAWAFQIFIILEVTYFEKIICSIINFNSVFMANIQ